MQAKTIYRFEYSDGSGIYYRADGKQLTAMFEFDRRHPTPWEDTRIANEVCYRMLPQYTFGFATLGQLRSWFYHDGHLQEMHSKDVVIAEYLCYPEDIVVGNAQAIFKRDKSIGKTQHNIKDYFKL